MSYTGFCLEFSPFRRSLRTVAGLLLTLLLACGASAATRVKDLSSVAGVRDNQLIGYGVVVGLAGTGDRRQTVFSAQSLANILDRMGVQVPATGLRVANIASVMVTATLLPYARTGNRIDVTVAAMGDAASLQGGLLLLTSLKGVDGQIYAVAQGPVVTGGFSAGGQGTTKTVNHPTVGRTANGAIVERSAPNVVPTGTLTLQLHRPDFTTAARLAEVISARYPTEGEPTAMPETAGTVAVIIPAKYKGKEAQFISELEPLMVETDTTARIVINERTGTIVLGKDVGIRPTQILHGTLTVEIQTTLNVSQPGPLSQGQTQITPDVSVKVSEEKARSVSLPPGAKVETLVKALIGIGATPRDIIAIIQNMKAAGAIDADIEII